VAKAATAGGPNHGESDVPNYLLIESRDHFTSQVVSGHLELAVGLRRAGSAVVLYLVQNGVLPCRAGADSGALHGALAAGVEVLADDFSLRERGIGERDVARGVKPASIGIVAGHLADSWKVMFL
jgi:hypothetical protein